MRRSPAAEHLAAPPVARQQLRTAHNVRKVCSTVPASDHVGFTTVAPPPEPREATCDCVETKKTHLNAWESESGYRRWSDFALRQSARGGGERRGPGSAQLWIRERGGQPFAQRTVFAKKHTDQRSGQKSQTLTRVGYIHQTTLSVTLLTHAGLPGRPRIRADALG